MKKSSFFLIIILTFLTGLLSAQSFVRTADLFHGAESSEHKINVSQDSAIDTLISRYVLMNTNLARKNTHPGMEGWRIQIYASSNRNAREESNKARAEFMNKFPELDSYILYAEPGYFKVRAGDFRTKTEATGVFLKVSEDFPDAYLVPDFINYPDQIKK